MYVLGKPTGGSLLASIQPHGYLGFAGIDAHCVGFETAPPGAARMHLASAQACACGNLGAVKGSTGSDR